MKNPAPKNPQAKNKIFPLISPPKSSGTYLLLNGADKYVYAGSSVNLHQRWTDWKATLRERVGIRSKVLHEAFGATDLADWSFVVVTLHPLDVLRAAESKLISTLPALYPGYAMLNVLSPQLGGKPQALGDYGQKSKIVDHKGRELSHREAATLVGCQIGTLRKRLADWRTKGKFEWSISELER